MINSRAALPGDLNRFEVMVDGNDVSASVLSAMIFFDIITAVWTCQIFFEDSMNHLTQLPIKSGTKVRVKVETKLESSTDGYKEFEFVVYNVTDMVAQNHMCYTYTIHCAATGFLIDQKTKIQQHYDGTASDVVRKVCSEYLAGAVTKSRPATGGVNIIVPNWSPLNTIAWAAKWAVYDGRADYMFFQNDNDAFSFLPINEMFNSAEFKLDFTFIQRPAGVRDNGEMKGDPCIQYKQYDLEHYDAVRAGLAGYFANKLLTFDMIGKKWESKTYTSGDAEGGDNEFAGMEDASVSFAPKHAGMFDGGASIYDTSAQWSGSRRSELQRLDREKLTLQVPLGAGAWKWVGKNVKVDLPSMEDETTLPNDKLRAGKYLIVAVCMILDKAEAVVNVELVKMKLESGG